MKNISCSIASLCRDASPESAIRLLKDAGFQSVDFPLSVFAQRLRQPDWRDWIKEISGICADLQMPVTQAHAPWHQDIPADFHYERPDEIFDRCIEACRILGCRQLIFHPLRQPLRVDEALFRRIHDYNVRWFHELIRPAEQNGVILNLENTFDSHHTQLPGDRDYPYTTARDMLALQRDIASPYVMLCLDTGHANISGQSVPEMIRAFGRELATVHLNDNYGKNAPGHQDLHLFPGYGQLDWKPIFDALREIRFRAPLNMEPIAELRRMPPQVRLIQLRAAAQTLLALGNL